MSLDLKSESILGIPTLSKLRARREEILALAAKYGASNVRVFGSVARGEATPDSDIDLLVEYAPHVSLLDVVGVHQGLTELLGRKVDIIDQDAIKPRYRTYILQDVIPL